MTGTDDEGLIHLRLTGACPEPGADGLQSDPRAVAPPIAQGTPQRNPPPDRHAPPAPRADPHAVSYRLGAYPARVGRSRRPQIGNPTDRRRPRPVVRCR